MIYVNDFKWTRVTLVTFKTIKFRPQNMDDKMSIAFKEAIKLSTHQACIINILYDETVNRRLTRKLLLVVARLINNSSIEYNDQYDRMNHINFIKKDYTNATYIFVFYYNK